MMFRLALAAALLLGAPAPARAQTQLEMNLEAHAAATKADARLNATYGRVAAGLAPRARRALVAAELKWIAFRDADADFQAGFHEGGSIRPMIRANAIERLTEARTAQLAATAPGRPDPAADPALNRAYQALMGDLGPPARKRLQRAELAWIAFRDAEAAYQALRFGVPKAGPLADLTRRRTLELQAHHNAGEERP